MSEDIPIASLAKQLGPLTRAEWELLRLLRGGTLRSFSVHVVRSPSGRWTVSCCDRDIAEEPSFGSGENFETAWERAREAVDRELRRLDA